MSGILKEFYYGNLEPQLRLIRGKSKLEEKIQLQNEAEVQLLQTLQDDEKAWFTKYIDTTHKINDASHIGLFSRRISAWFKVYLRYVCK